MTENEEPPGYHKTIYNLKNFKQLSRKHALSLVFRRFWILFIFILFLTSGVVFAVGWVCGTSATSKNYMKYFQDFNNPLKKINKYSHSQIKLNNDVANECDEIVCGQHAECIPILKEQEFNFGAKLHLHSQCK